ncbi:phage minor head protein [Propionivibrio limicola]|uniref:phage minor head protein n=1 Tax=Propionivibrio limicola TaxID=167645 RepID=UPI0012925A2A|nr:phage minor head protein [Propionivibrio limicola]
MPEHDAQLFAKLQSLTSQEAVDYLKARGQLTQTFSWQDLWHEEHGQQFTVSRLARLDLLKAVQDGITKSVEGDLSRRDWTRNIKALLAKEGWWGEVKGKDPASGEEVTTKFDNARLKLIYDTNTRMAYSAGMWDRSWRNRSTHPYVRYITKDDARVRATHRAWNNLVLPIDDPFWETHWPPNAWRCRCRVTGMTAREYEKRRAAGTINTKAPPERLVEWTNKRTGEISHVPLGIAPGFDYNPGLARTRQDGLHKVGLDKLNNLPAPIRRAAMQPVVTPGVAQEFSREVSDAHLALPEATRQALASAGYEIHVVDRISRAAPDLAGPSGDQIDGLTRYAKRQILIAEQAFDISSNTWKAALPGRGASVLQHEVGHALDEIYQLAKIPEVEAAWRKEASTLAAYRDNGGAEFSKEIDYFTKKFPNGLLETIAELYALRHGSGTASLLNVMAAFPETRAALYKAIEGKGL